MIDHSNGPFLSKGLSAGQARGLAREVDAFSLANSSNKRQMGLYAKGRESANKFGKWATEAKADGDVEGAADLIGSAKRARVVSRNSLKTLNQRAFDRRVSRKRQLP